MKTLYIECKMGAAGDMLMAALYELLTAEEKTEYLDTMNALFPEVALVVPEKDKKCGISGTHMRVTIRGEEEHSGGHHAPAEHHHSPEDVHAHEHTHSHSVEHCHQHAHDDEPSHTHTHDGNHCHQHAHYSYSSLVEQIRHLPLPEKVCSDAEDVYRLIGEAESKVHDTTIEQIHFHEVGSLDALMDVVGCCLLLSMIGADAVYASPIHVGNGTVHCAHGILPVPAPATAEILKGIPYYTGDIPSELCTPTGAAILRHFVREFMSMPVFSTTSIGIGLGTKDFEAANCVRIFQGECFDRKKTATANDAGTTDTVCDLSCNLDDMTGEALGYCMEVLFEEGALDVFYQAIQMKKNRPGVLLHCLCRPDDSKRFIRLILMHTTTRGVRCELLTRATLDARTENVETSYGIIRKKISTGYGISKEKYEFEDIRKAAMENGFSLAEFKKLL